MLVVGSGFRLKSIQSVEYVSDVMCKNIIIQFNDCRKHQRQQWSYKFAYYSSHGVANAVICSVSSFMDHKRLWLSICGGRYKFRVEIVSVAAGATLRQRGERCRVAVGSRRRGQSWRCRTGALRQGKAEPGRVRLNWAPAGGRRPGRTWITLSRLTHDRRAAFVRRCRQSTVLSGASTRRAPVIATVTSLQVSADMHCQENMVLKINKQQIMMMKTTTG